MSIRSVIGIRRLAIALGAAFVVVSAQSASAVGSPVGLGTASSFAVLAGTTVTNTGPSTISGNVGVSPGTAVVGFPPGVITNGVIHSANTVALQAQADTTVAYNDAAGRTSTATISANLGGQTLVSGVYSGGALALTGTLTLDAENDPDAVFIFQATSTLITSSSSSVVLLRGANPCNVFWQVGSSATLGTSSTFVGTILALTSITAARGANVEGRLLARNGAVTLDRNVITVPICESGPSGNGGSTTTTLASAPGNGGSTTTIAGTPGATATTTTIPGSVTTAVTTTTTVPKTDLASTGGINGATLPVVALLVGLGGGLVFWTARRLSE